MIAIMTDRIRLTTRKSALARKQTDLAAAWLRERWPGTEISIHPVSSVGDERQNWSLEERGGAGLFTSALEQALLAGEADLAVHSAKDLPTTMTAGLVLAGYLPRANAADVLILRAGVKSPRLLATASPRRRAQMKRIFPQADFRELRGNVETRLEKIRKGKADGTIMAAAGLQRLDLWHWPGLSFLPLPVRSSVPAAAQGAIAIQCRAGEDLPLKGIFCTETAHAVELERTFLASLGGGCHAAVAAHFVNGRLHAFTEDHGYRCFPLQVGDSVETVRALAETLLQEETEEP
jgi:hydroxymethylbilane synthase